MRRNLLPGLTALVFAVSCMSAEAKLSDDPSGLRVLADNELGQSGRAPVEYVWGDEIPPDSTAPVSTLTANQSDDQVESYYAEDGPVTVAATGLAVILLGGLALVGSALRRRAARQAGRSEGWRAELMEYLEDNLANFVAVMQGVPSQPERARAPRQPLAAWYILPSRSWGMSCSTRSRRRLRPRHEAILHPISLGDPMPRNLLLKVTGAKRARLKI
jgi:hypothetical protein